MSKHESWRTKKYWENLENGLLIEEFLAIPQSRDRSVGRRLIDGVIVLNVEKAIQYGGTFDLEGKDIIAIQTKATRLGMSLMGQAFFTREILKRFKPKSIKTVAICGKGDIEMEKLCEQASIEVVVIPESDKCQ